MVTEMVLELGIEQRTHWRWWVTPKLLAEKPIHRWYIFPHSFSSELVHALIDEWGLTPEDHILDPFAGAGTTLLAAKEKGIPATGYDLSPLAVLASRVKIADYAADRLDQLWSSLLRVPWLSGDRRLARNYPDLVRRALPGKLLAACDELDRMIAGLDATEVERDFFRLALLATIPKYSRAVAKGGWLCWVDRRGNVARLWGDFIDRVCLMLEDVNKAPHHEAAFWQIRLGDARALPDASSLYSAVITSPPYPNRHDYTRIFGVELMFGFLDWEQTRRLRYQSFQSHPEARPVRGAAEGYVQPPGLMRAVAEITARGESQRIVRMIEGYFVDLYLVLREIRRVCKPEARVGLVVGNAQYRGVPLMVDEWSAEIGEQVGLRCEKLLVARYRGSAQQMGVYGRRPSREGIVVFRVPWRNVRRKNCND